MQAWLRWAILVGVLAVLSPLSPPARAELGNCANSEYIARFDARLIESGFDCVERLRVSAGVGSREIRIIHDRRASLILDEAGFAEFDRAVRAAPAALARLGGIQLEDITILLADSFPPDDPRARTFGEIAAWTDYQNDGECRIVLYLLSPGASRRLAAWVTTHEIFHCVQVANLSPAQMSSGGGGTGSGGDWWMEGSASWFAALALPDDHEWYQADIREFDARSPTTPINRLGYDALPFFLWLGAERSPPGVMRFLAGMADSNAETAQRRAMAAALSQEEWLRFAQAYLDNEIRHPHGRALVFSPQQGEIWEWSATQTRTAPLEPFVLHRGVVAFQCGRWATSVRPNQMHSARPEDGGGWSALPSSIDTTSGSGGNYRFAAINAGASRATLSVQGTMEAGCGDCAGERELDACLVGSWQLTSGGAVEWMRSQGLPAAAHMSMSDQSITFRADGTYLTGAAHGTMDAPMRDGGRAQGQIHAQAGGRWSARGGQLNLCADMQRLSGYTDFITPEGRRVRVPVPAAGPNVSQHSYSCSAGSLNTITPLPDGAGSIPTGYTRMGE